jgi:hypothetical protein
MTTAVEFKINIPTKMNPYLSLVSIRLPEELRQEASRNYLKSGGSNLLQSWPIAGLPAIPSTSIRSSSRRKSIR